MTDLRHRATAGIASDTNRMCFNITLRRCAGATKPVWRGLWGDLNLSGRRVTRGPRVFPASPRVGEIDATEGVPHTTMASQWIGRSCRTNSGGHRRRNYQRLANPIRSTEFI
jgi:hypothetical protein